MAEVVVVDAGPLVALLRHDDQHHVACREAVRALQPPLITTWLAVTEAAWLLRRVNGGVLGLVELLESGLVRCYEPDAAFAPWLREFLVQFADLSPQIADASLVYAANAHRTNAILTLDRRDFVVFRDAQGEPFRLLPDAI